MATRDVYVVNPYCSSSVVGDEKAAYVTIYDLVSRDEDRRLRHVMDEKHGSVQRSMRAHAIQTEACIHTYILLSSVVVVEVSLASSTCFAHFHRFVAPPYSANGHSNPHFIMQKFHNLPF